MRSDYNNNNNSNNNIFILEGGEYYVGVHENFQSSWVKVYFQMYLWHKGSIHGLLFL